MKSILITGASFGIGAEIARKAAKSGKYSRIVLNSSKSSAELNSVADECRKIYPLNSSFECLTYVGDISDITFVESIHSEIHGVDEIINNAAISYFGLLTDTTPEQWHRILDVNITSIYNTCHSFLPEMIAKKSGKIINISSVWGNVGASCEVPYSTTKGAVNAFTKALAKEVAPSNIQVNAVAFGMVDTRMNSRLSQEDIDSLRDDIPANRIMGCEEAAEAVLKVLEMPEYMTGQIITVDGGWI